MLLMPLCMGQHALPAGSKLRNIVFRDQVLFVELDHGFQFTIADGRLLILPDILAIFTLTGQIRLGEYTGSDYTLSPEHWKPRFRGEETALTLWYLIIMQ